MQEIAAHRSACSQIAGRGIMRRSGWRWTSILIIAMLTVPILITPPTGAYAATFTIANGDVAHLISAITTANGNGQDNTIILASGGMYTLSLVNNGDPTTATANGLPVISGTHTLTIVGNGATIARSAAGGTPNFRFFQVNSGAALALNNLTLTNGLVLGTNGAPGTVGADGATGTIGPPVAVNGGPGGNRRSGWRRCERAGRRDPQ